jgi:hypothetical protein
MRQNKIGREAASAVREDELEGSCEAKTEAVIYVVAV